MQSLAYFYIRSLIYRPAAGSSVGSKASSSVIALADSCKHIVQIVQLLEERNMSFSFCLNKNEMLMLAGFGLLFEGFELKQEGKLIKDNQKLICSLIQQLDLASAPSAGEFKKVCSSMMVTPKASKAGSRRSSEVYPSTTNTTPRRLQILAARPPSFSDPSPPKDLQFEASCRAASSKIQRPQLCKLPNVSHLSISSTRSEPSISRMPQSLVMPRKSAQNLPIEIPNLDYLPFDSDKDVQHAKSPPVLQFTQGGLSNWENLLASSQLGEADLQQHGLNNTKPTFQSVSFSGPSTDTNSWSPDNWDPVPPSACSVISFSEESHASGEEFTSTEHLHSSCDSYPGITVPNTVDTEVYGWDPLEETFGL